MDRLLTPIHISKQNPLGSPGTDISFAYFMTVGSPLHNQLPVCNLVCKPWPTREPPEKQDLPVPTERASGVAFLMEECPQQQRKVPDPCDNWAAGTYGLQPKRLENGCLVMRGHVQGSSVISHSTHVSKSCVCVQANVTATVCKTAILRKKDRNR